MLVNLMLSQFMMFVMAYPINIPANIINLIWEMPIICHGFCNAHILMHFQLSEQTMLLASILPSMYIGD